jgi:hypothetical protein
MPEVRQLLEGALSRFDTLVTTIVEWHDAELLHRAWTKGGEGVSTVTATRATTRPTAPTGAVGRVDGRMWRVWWRKPDRWRADVHQGGELRAVNVWRGTTASSYGAEAGIMSTNDPTLRAQSRPPRSGQPAFGLPTLESELTQVPLFRPPFIDAGWDIRVIGDERELLGRTAIDISARRARPHVAGDDLRWSEFAEFVAVVDVERGLPLRMAGMVDGREAATYAMQSIRFDDPIPDDVFDFRPPAGTVIVQAAPEPDHPREAMRARWWRR